MPKIFKTYPEIALLYKESIKQKKPELTEMDFLAYLAIRKEIIKISKPPVCPNSTVVMMRYLNNPDSFINKTLGVKGSQIRKCYEKKASILLRHAKIYFQTSDKKIRAKAKKSMSDIQTTQCETVKPKVEEYDRYLL